MTVEILTDAARPDAYPLLVFGGMPGVNSGGAFWITVVILAVIVGIEFMLFKLMKWL